MPDYFCLIAKHYPAVEVECVDDHENYNDLVHLGGDPIPSQADLDAKDLLDYKTAKILALSASAAADIVNGFQSEAGGLHTAPGKWYDSQPEDQVNMIGSVAVGDTMDYPCRDTQTGDKSYVEHTNAQLQAVLQDGRDVKLTTLQTFNTKKGTVLACADKACVDAVTW